MLTTLETNLSVQRQPRTVGVHKGHNSSWLRLQATVGDVTGSQPWAVQIEARLKYNAWAKLKGVSKEEAMQSYIDLLGDPADWEEHEAFQQYPGPQWM